MQMEWTWNGHGMADVSRDCILEFSSVYTEEFPHSSELHISQYCARQVIKRFLSLCVVVSKGKWAKTAIKVVT